MMLTRNRICSCAIVCFFLLDYSVLGVNSEAVELGEQQYKQELSRIHSMRNSLKPGLVNDLEEYEKFADEIQKKWRQGTKQNYANLMLEICKPLSSGNFRSNRRHELARRYALSALEKPEEIRIEMELELTGHAVTLMYTPDSPKGEDFAQRRKKDIEVRLHAWNRLTGAIDPSWDPNDVPFINVPLPPGVEGISGMSPDAIEDPQRRAEYEAAIERNKRKAERYNEQYRLRNWLKRFPKRAEEYIILAYSEPPFNLEELKQYLAKYIADQKTKASILNAVTKNMEAQAERELKKPKEAPANPTQR